MKRLLANAPEQRKRRGRRIALLLFRIRQGQPTGIRNALDKKETKKEREKDARKRRMRKTGVASKQARPELPRPVLLNQSLHKKPRKEVSNNKKSKQQLAGPLVFRDVKPVKYCRIEKRISKSSAFWPFDSDIMQKTRQVFGMN